MRRLWPLLLVALLVPTVAGHEGEEDCGDISPFEEFSHLRLWEATVAPGQEVSRMLSFGSCPLQEGWWVTVWIDADGPLQMRMEHDGTLAAWDMDGVATPTLQMPVSGFPDLVLNNTGTEPARFRLYFDQTCDCTFKGVPVPSGPLWFNADAKAGDTVRFDFRFAATTIALQEPEVPETITVRTARVVPGADGNQELSVTQSTFHPRTEASCQPDALRFVGCQSVSFTATEDGTQYLWMWVEHDGDPAWLVQVSPVLTVDKEAPAAPVALLLLALVALTASRR